MGSRVSGIFAVIALGECRWQVRHTCCDLTYVVAMVTRHYTAGSELYRLLSRNCHDYRWLTIIIPNMLENVHNQETIGLDNFVKPPCTSNEEMVKTFNHSFPTLIFCILAKRGRCIGPISHCCHIKPTSTHLFWQQTDLHYLFPR